MLPSSPCSRLDVLQGGVLQVQAQSQVQIRAGHLHDRRDAAQLTPHQIGQRRRGRAALRLLPVNHGRCHLLGCAPLPGRTLGPRLP